MGMSFAYGGAPDAESIKTLHHTLELGVTFWDTAEVYGRLPTVEEYMGYAQNINSMAADVHRYLSFDQIADFRNAAENAKVPVVQA